MQVYLVQLMRRVLTYPCHKRTLFLHMKAIFQRVSSREWILRRSVSTERRKKLLRGPTFHNIVQRICKHAIVISHKKTKIDEHRGYYRAEVTLKLNATTVDCFHNSATGYRAQYYKAIRNGELANKYAVHRLIPVIVGRLNELEKRACPIWWLKKSLLHPEAKLWIYQGRWLRLAKQCDRNLLVKRWLSHDFPQYSNEKQKRVWGTLTPKGETRINLKGGGVTLKGFLLTKKLKPERGKEIHDLGYT